MNLRTVSLFTGAGGLDTGFDNMGYEIIKANEFDKNAAQTYTINHPETKMIIGDITKHLSDLYNTKDVDVVIGGPPCQGFSVAGKMDENDPRNKMVWEYLKVVDKLKPKAFVIENVKALYSLKKWSPIREKIITDASKMGYTCVPILLTATDFDVPQKRQRVFFIGVKDKYISEDELRVAFDQVKETASSVRNILLAVGKAGTDKNPINSVAKITFASNPILRKSPYSGMLFNGAGRPINLDEYSNTLPASMGGNKTPIIDDEALYDNKENFVVGYHRKIVKGEKATFKEAPKRLRRLTIKEAAAIQTFPTDYKFAGPMSSQYKQIGNAVPVKLAEAVAKVVKRLLSDDSSYKEQLKQLELFA